MNINQQALLAAYPRYAASPASYDARISAVQAGFRKVFGAADGLRIFSAPGRTELGGNHTDHQQGAVLAAAIDLDVLAAARENATDTVRIFSEGYQLDEIPLDDLSVQLAEVNTSAALVRGVAAKFTSLGHRIGGFDAYITSNVLKGSGLSSSAAYEVLLGTIMNALFCEGKHTAIELAQFGQYAENAYFGKPCGLMDQMASSVGNIVAIDFADFNHPVVEKVDFDFTQSGHALCILDSGADHADLTDEYAAIPAEMKAVAAQLGKKVLREVSPEDFHREIPVLVARLGDRAVLRAMHFFADHQRAIAEANCLRQGDFDRFLTLIKESGQSSWMYLQNVTVAGSTRHQEVGLALALVASLLGERGGYRVHGGGFAGTIQAFVPLDLLDGFVSETERVLGKGRCHVLSVREAGGIELTKEN